MSWNNSPRTFIAGTGGVSYGQLVKLDTGEVVKNTVTDSDQPIGVALGDAADGEAVAIRLLNQIGTVEMIAAGVIALNADIYAAADGEISALSAVAGDYKKIGIALEASTADQAIIEILPYDYHTVTTVT